MKPCWDTWWRPCSDSSVARTCSRSHRHWSYRRKPTMMPSCSIQYLPIECIRSVVHRSCIRHASTTYDRSNVWIRCWPVGCKGRATRAASAIVSRREQDRMAERAELLELGSASLLVLVGEIWLDVAVRDWMYPWCIGSIQHVVEVLLMNASIKRTNTCIHDWARRKRYLSNCGVSLFTYQERVNMRSSSLRYKPRRDAYCNAHNDLNVESRLDARSLRIVWSLDHSNRLSSSSRLTDWATSVRWLSIIQQQQHDDAHCWAACSKSDRLQGRSR